MHRPVFVGPTSINAAYRRDNTGEIVSSDIEIAQKATLKPIGEIAARLGIPAASIENYGHYKAKIALDYIESLKGKPDGKLILVTALSPTPAGEGKTTTTVGLGDALNKIGKKAVICLREPSLGPVFGMKGGAAGGGYAQVVPMEDINLHFTGDFSAIGLAHNLLSALIDNHVYHGNELGFDVRRVAWKRVVDMNDRALRDITVGLGGPGNGYPRQDGFDIVVASEVMAIFCLAKSLVDLKERLGNIVVGYRRDLTPIHARDLKAQGAMTVLLKEALKPNLVQTLENNPAFIHGGPFANIAHGCNSVLATSTALKLADYVVTEAGFGADLGAEKFIDIKCRKSGLRPAAVVIVATVRALKFHGGADLKEINKENLAALEKGVANLERHVSNVRNQYGLPCIVSVNHFTADTDAEHALLAKKMASLEVPLVLARHWAEGGAGAADLARKVVEIADKGARELPLRLRRETDAVGQGEDHRHQDLRRRRHLGRLEDSRSFRRAAEELRAVSRMHRQDPVFLLHGSKLARCAERTHGQHPRSAPRRRRGVHRGGVRRRDDHAGTAEGSFRRQDRHRCAGARRGSVLTRSLALLAENCAEGQSHLGAHLRRRQFFAAVVAQLEDFDLAALRRHGDTLLADGGDGTDGALDLGKGLHRMLARGMHLQFLAFETGPCRRGRIAAADEVVDQVDVVVPVDARFGAAAPALVARLRLVLHAPRRAAGHDLVGRLLQSRDPERK